MTETAADAQTELAMQWCSTFTDADYPQCLAIARDMVEHTERDAGDEPMFAYKSLAQSLHFLGEHEEARRVAERVQREAKGYLTCTPVHPYISMGIVLARIACLTGNGAEGAEIAGDVLMRSRRGNQVANCQTLALACVPIAVWNGDEDSARQRTLELIGEAEADQLNYWSNWGRQLLAAIDLHFGSTGAQDSALDVDGFDALLADHLATMDSRAISQLALRRVFDHTVGWSAPDVLRTQAASTGWFDRAGALRLIEEARDMAQRQGAATWLSRIEVTEAEMTLAFKPTVGSSRHATL